MDLDVVMDLDMEKNTDRLGHGEGHGNKHGHSTIWISDTGFLYIKNIHYPTYCRIQPL